MHLSIVTFEHHLTRTLYFPFASLSPHLPQYVQLSSSKPYTEVALVPAGVTESWRQGQITAASSRILLNDAFYFISPEFTQHYW